MGKKPPQWLPGERVDETILLQRRSVEELKADRIIKRKGDAATQARERMREKLEIKKAKKLSTRRFTSAQAILHTAEKRVKNARIYAKAAEKFDTRRSVRDQSKTSQVYKNARVALVIRAKGKMLPKEVKDGFDALKLNKLYTARLVLLTPQMHKQLLQLKRFASVGYPTRDQLEALLRSRGAIMNSSVKGGTFRTPLTGNMVVESAFAESHNVYTIEELADAIFSKMRKVQALLERVATFDLHPPRQMFFERNRSVHEKLEILNAQSFAALLSSSLDVKPAVKSQQQKGKKPAAAPVSADAAPAAAAKAPAASGKKKASAATTAAAKLPKSSGARRARD